MHLFCSKIDNLLSVLNWKANNGSIKMEAILRWLTFMNRNNWPQTASGTKSPTHAKHTEPRPDVRNAYHESLHQIPKAVAFKTDEVRDRGHQYETAHESGTKMESAPDPVGNTHGDTVGGWSARTRAGAQSIALPDSVPRAHGASYSRGTMMKQVLGNAALDLLGDLLV